MSDTRTYYIASHELLLPCEPLYDLQCANRLIPIQYEALRKFLSRHKGQFPAQYRRSTGGRRIRLLSVSEIREIRRMVIVEGKPIKRSVVRGLLDSSSHNPKSLP